MQLSLVVENMSTSPDTNLGIKIHWIIENYNQQKENRFLESNLYKVPGCFGKIRFSIQFYSKSYRRHNFTSIYLHLLPSKALDITFKYKLFILKDKQRINTIQFTNHFDCTETGQGVRCGMTDYMKQSEIKKYLDDEGALHVCCNVKVRNFSYRLSGNLLRLLKSGNYSDAVILVQGQEFQVHKAVVASRSKVFANLFQNSSKIYIEDVDINTFSKLLLFIYTGKFSFDGDLKFMDVVNKFRIM